MKNLSAKYKALEVTFNREVMGGFAVTRDNFRRFFIH
jgi:hypothetical protein